MPINTISKSSDGRYSYSVSDKSGKRHFLKSRKNELKKDFSIRCTELDKKINGSTSCTLKDAFIFYLTTSTASTGRKKVVLSHMKKFAHLFNIDFREIKKQDIVNALKGSKHSPKYTKSIITSFTSVCNFYCDYYDIARITCPPNIMKYFEFTSSRPHKEISESDYKKLLDYLKDKSSDAYKFCVVLYETGMRPSELLANNRHDNKFIYIEKGLTAFGYSEGKTHNSKRKVPLSKIALQNLIEFPPQTITRTNRFLHNAEKEINVKVTLYDFRHTFATRMARKGVNIKALQQVLGHATSNFTLTFYVKANDNDLLNILN